MTSVMPQTGPRDVACSDPSSNSDSGFERIGVHPAPHAAASADPGTTPPRDEEETKFIVSQSKKAGNGLFKEKKYRDAIKMYSQAIAGDETDHTLFSNRSAAYLAVGLLDAALWDARKTVELRPEWPKGYYRLGCALESMNELESALAAFEKGSIVSAAGPGSSGPAGLPGTPDPGIEAKVKQSRLMVNRDREATNAAAAVERHNLVAKLRNARHEDQKLSMLNQFKQSMTAPDWELEDLEWRPTWIQSLRTLPVEPREWIAAVPKRAGLLSYVTAVGDVGAPKHALKILEDAPRLEWFADACAGAFDDARSALVISAGGGVLGLAAAKAGASAVTQVERSRMLYRMAKQVKESNEREGAPLKACCERIDLVSGVLESVRVDEGAAIRVETEEATGETGETGESHEDSVETVDSAKYMMRTKADALVIDLLDHTVLGLGLLRAVDYAAEHLLAPGARVLPGNVKIVGQLVQMKLDPLVCGFDLSAMDQYRWYPGDERLDLASTSTNFATLSDPFVVVDIDLAARIKKVQRRKGLCATAKDGGEKAGEPDGHAADAHADDAASDDPSSDPSSSDPWTTAPWEFDETVSVPVTAAGQWNSVVFWFELSSEYHPRGRDLVLSSRNGSLSKSWGQAIQYVGARNITVGDNVSLRVQQDASQVVFTADPPQHRMHHALVPRWHYDMIMDVERNQAYDAAIRKAIEAKKSAFPDRPVHCIDMGAGSGLLSMMAARAGADYTYAAELNSHMCDVAEECTISNGFLDKILVLDRDVRRMDVLRKPDGTAPELRRPVDLAVFEVFDSGLIGEGVLHILAAAKAKLLMPDASLVPCRAEVFAQPIQMRFDTVLGDIDVRQTNRWRWRADYEGVELGKIRSKNPDAWTPLADPAKVFSFDFSDIQRCAQDNERLMTFETTADGTCNAIAMWFNLYLDDEDTILLSTSPYDDKGPTWQQAVQYVREVGLKKGDSLQIKASHDTYSISYKLADTEAMRDKQTAVPMFDAVWKAACDRLEAFNSELVKSCVQSPVEYRFVSQSAIAMAARAADFRLESSQASDFASRMMG